MKRWELAEIACPLFGLFTSSVSLISYSSEVFNVGKIFAFKLCNFNTQFDGGTSVGGPSNFGFISFVFFLEALISFLDLAGRPMWMIALHG